MKGDQIRAATRTKYAIDTYTRLIGCDVVHRVPRILELENTKHTKHTHTHKLWHRLTFCLFTNIIYTQLYRFAVALNRGAREGDQLFYLWPNRWRKCACDLAVGIPTI